MNLECHYTRPEKIKKYKKQAEFIDCPKRFTIVEATTKAGKTVGCLVWLLEEALHGKDGDVCWWVAPTFTIAKIAFRRMKRYIQPLGLYEENKSELVLTLINGVSIFFKGADNPDSLFGEDVIAAVLDESTRMKEDAWVAVFTTLSATEGRCKIIGNVKGTGNWAYRLARDTESGNKADWAYFKITAADAVKAGLMKQRVVDEAEKTLQRGVFLELYYGIPFENSSDKFCYSFDEKKHVKSCVWKSDEITYLSFDFNVNPVTCMIIQDYGNIIRVPEVIQLENSNIYRLCDAIKIKYPNAYFLVTGDASGKNKSTLNPDNMNNFDVIKSILGLSKGQMQYAASNPKLDENQILVNAVLEHHPVEIDPDKSQRLINDCKFVEMRADKTIKKGDRDDPNQQADALDCFRYFLNRYYRNFMKYITKNE
ncbi:MAG: hypothetical protein FWF53_06965 [Candidatus Azobacteroides sp.]|nr:hypothetical protein [Candidatus Azobacteroides sp.]